MEVQTKNLLDGLLHHTDKIAWVALVRPRKTLSMTVIRPCSPYRMTLQEEWNAIWGNWSFFFCGSTAFWSVCVLCKTRFVWIDILLHNRGMNKDVSLCSQTTCFFSLALLSFFSGCQVMSDYGGSRACCISLTDLGNASNPEKNPRVTRHYPHHS